MGSERERLGAKQTEFCSRNQLVWLLSVRRDQRKSKTLDIITGFQVLDGQYHVFVLEGLANEGIKKLWDKLPRPQEEGRYIVNSFNVRIKIIQTNLSSFHKELHVDKRIWQRIKAFSLRWSFH